MKRFYIILLVFAIVFGIALLYLAAKEEPLNIEGENMKETYKQVTFAGGCFWCIEAAFDTLPGIENAISGYIGGSKINPNYEEVSAGGTGHFEAVHIIYQEEEISYKELLDVFWRQIDPTDDEGQFVDRGSQYRTAIFYYDQEQKRQAEESKNELEASGKFDKPIVTQILKASEFYKAEEYHQNFSKRCKLRYKAYHANSGRSRYIEETWKDQEPGRDKEFIKPTDDELRKILTPLQFKVTRKDATEPAFKNEYWDNKDEGIYVDVASGEPLFGSLDKFRSGTGWPSFTRVLEPENIVERIDTKLFAKRTEVRSKNADSHLGHVFGDGPDPAGLRYCINSAALRFIPKEDLEKEGYGGYKELFD